MERYPLVTADATSALRQYTDARIALGRAGGSLPTQAWLAFKASHAAARDAVYLPFDAEQVQHALAGLGCETRLVASAAPDRATYLLRPDLGRRLDEQSRESLLSTAAPSASYDLAIIVSDGLSAMAAHQWAVPVLAALLPRLAEDRWNLAPIVVARFGRVALQDEIGGILQSQMALILIGERPGLAAPDSLGAYMVYGPKGANTDADRNCVSNIRLGGLSCDAAADAIHHLLIQARHRKLSGVQLAVDAPAIEGRTSGRTRSSDERERSPPPLEAPN